MAESLILWLGVGEGDGICRDCKAGPHIHVTPAVDAERAVLSNVKQARKAAKAKQLDALVSARLLPVLSAMGETAEALERVMRRLDAQTEAIAALRVEPIGDDHGVPF